MKRLTLMTALLATLAAPALFAQSTLNTTAPGPSMETKPGQTNNNLQNPGSNMQQPAAQTGTVTTTTTTGTSTATDTTAPAAPLNNDSTTGTTGTLNNDSTTGTTTGTMNNDSTTGTTTGTGSYNGSSATGAGTSTTDTTTSTTSSTSLPRTASELPTVAIAGLLALAAFFAVRLYSKRNA